MTDDIAAVIARVRTTTRIDTANVYRTGDALWADDLNALLAHIEAQDERIAKAEAGWNALNRQLGEQVDETAKVRARAEKAEADLDAANALADRDAVHSAPAEPLDWLTAERVLVRAGLLNEAEALRERFIEVVPEAPATDASAQAGRAAALKRRLVDEAGATTDELAELVAMFERAAPATDARTAAVWRCNCPHEARVGCGEPRCPHWKPARPAPAPDEALRVSLRS